MIRESKRDESSICDYGLPISLSFWFLWLVSLVLIHICICLFLSVKDILLWISLKLCLCIFSYSSHYHLRIHAKLTAECWFKHCFDKKHSNPSRKIHRIKFVSFKHHRCYFLWKIDNLNQFWMIDKVNNNMANGVKIEIFAPFFETCSLFKS